MTTKPLNSMIQSLRDIDYDALRDLKDLIAAAMYSQLLRDATRRSKSDNPTPKQREYKRAIALIKDGRRGRTAFTQLKYPAALQGDPEKLTQPERETLIAVLEVLIHAKRPLAATTQDSTGDRVARGHFEVKKKKTYKARKDAEGNPELDDTGNVIMDEIIKRYLYFRVYVVNQEGTKRPASIYIGSLNRAEPKPFMAAVSAGTITREDLIAKFAEGGYEAIKAWRQSMDDTDEFGISRNVPGELPAWARQLINRYT